MKKIAAVLLALTILAPGAFMACDCCDAVNQDFGSGSLQAEFCSPHSCCPDMQTVSKDCAVKIEELKSLAAPFFSHSFNPIVLAVKTETRMDPASSPAVRSLSPPPGLFDPLYLSLNVLRI